MALSERLDFILNAKGADQVQREFGKVGRSATGQLGKAGDETERLSANLIRTGAASLAFAGVAGAAMFKLASGASDVNERMSAATQVFGDATGEVSKFAKTAAADFGLSEEAALGAATQFGQLGKAAGLAGPDLAAFSTTLTGLAGDMASFANVDVSEAIAALGSGLRGEAEPLRRFGVLLDDATIKQAAMEAGLYDGNGALNQQQKTFGAYLSVLKQTTDIQGDYARTSESLANSQRTLASELTNLGAAVGQGALPLFEGLFGSANSVVGAFNDLGPSVQSSVGAIGSGVVTFAALNGAMRLGGGLIGKYSTNVAALGTGMSGTGTAALLAKRGVAGTATAMAGLAGVAGPAALGIAGVVAGLQVFSGIANAVNRTAEKLADAMREVGAAETDMEFTEAFAGMVKAEGSAINLGNSFGRLARALSLGEGAIYRVSEGTADYVNEMTYAGKSVPANIDNVRDALGKLNLVQLDQAIAEMEAYAEAGEGSAEDRRRNAEMAAEMAEKSEHSTKALIEEAMAETRLKAAMQGALETRQREEATYESLTKAVEEYGEALGKAGADVELAAAAASGFVTAMADLNRLDDAVDAAQDLGEALSTVGDDLAQLPADFDLATAAAGGYTAEQNASVDALQALGGAMTAHLGSLLAQGASTADVTAAAAAHRAQLGEVLAQLGITGAQAQEYIDILGLTPEQVETALLLSNYERSMLWLQIYQQELNALPPEKRSMILALIDQGRLHAAERALAVLARPRSTFMTVYERVVRTGHAFPTLTEGRGRALPAQNAAAVAGPSTVNVYLQPGADGHDVVDATRRWTRRNGRDYGWGAA